MVFSIKTKIWNGSFLVFLLVTLLGFGVMALADEGEAITTYFEDGDQDGLSAEEEKAFGTDPTNNDTDGDGYSDGVEIESGYDPLKPAPGDRITPEDEATDETGNSDTSNGVNLTDAASDELLAIVEEKQVSQEELTPDDLNAAVAKVMEDANQEVELPEVNVEEIKVKELEKGLSDEEEKEAMKQDTLEYLTTVSYILMSNSPVTVHSKEEIGSALLKSTQSVIVALSTGNLSMFDEIDAKSKTILEELKGLKVPENMVGTHTKALQMVELVSVLGKNMKNVDFTNDPIGQMLEVSKLQGALFTMQGFLDDSTQKMSELGITNLPLDF